MRKFVRGFGLIEMLIAMTVTGLIMFGVMQVMDSMSRMGRRGDTKNEMGSLDTRLRNLMTDEATCKTTLVDQLPTQPPTFTPTVGVALPTFPARIRFSDGTFLEANAPQEKFIVEQLTLELIGPLPDNSRYEAKLVMKVDTRQAGGRTLAGGELAPRTIPLVLKTDAVPGGGGARKIVGCYSKSISGAEMCQAIGGRWLESLEKCYFGGDLKLNQFECPTDMSEITNLGAVVDECYYRPNASTVWKTLRCVNRKSTNGPRCRCAPTDAGWRQLNPTTNHVYRECDGGVMIRVPDPSVFLEFNEYIEGKFFGTLPVDEMGVAYGTAFTGANMNIAEFRLNHDILDSVQECAFEEGDESRLYTCKQDANATKGGKGSCIYINHGFATGQAEPYTGWIYVTSARGFYTIGGGSNQHTQVVEARGRKCFSVRRVANADPVVTPAFTGVSATTGGASVLTDANAAQDIRECLFLGGLDRASPDIDPPASSPWRGGYLQRFACENKEVTLENLVGDVPPDDDPPDLKKGTCWYFNDVKLPKRFWKGVLNSSVTTLGRYTGWVYMLGDMPINKFSVTAGTNVVTANATGTTLNGVPCNAGVRLTQ